MMYKYTKLQVQLCFTSSLEMTCYGTCQQYLLLFFTVLHYCILLLCHTLHFLLCESCARLLYFEFILYIFYYYYFSVCRSLQS